MWVVQGGPDTRGRNLNMNLHMAWIGVKQELM